MTEHYDVSIFGGGPAGLSTAIALKSLGRSVVLIERTDYRDIRIGEHAAPQFSSLLAQLGITDILSERHAKTSAGIVSTWRGGHIDSINHIASAWGCGANLERPLFERCLASKADDHGIRVIKSCRPSVVSNNEEWEIDVRGDTQNSRLKATFAIDASGRSAWLLRSLRRKPQKMDNTIGLLSYCLPRTAVCFEDSRMFIEPTSNGWWYTAPLANGYIAATFVTDSDFLIASSCKPSEFWSNNIRRTRYTRERVKFGRNELQVHVRPAHSQLARQVAFNNWIAVGDAALAQDPLSGNGLSDAIRSGIRAAATVHKWLDGNQAALGTYQREHEKAVSEYLRQRTYSYNMVSSELKPHIFWNRRLVKPQ